MALITVDAQRYDDAGHFRVRLPPTRVEVPDHDVPALADALRTSCALLYAERSGTHANARGERTLMNTRVLARDFAVRSRLFGVADDTMQWMGAILVAAMDKTAVPTSETLSALTLKRPWANDGSAMGVMERLVTFQLEHGRDATLRMADHVLGALISAGAPVPVAGDFGVQTASGEWLAFCVDRANADRVLAAYPAARTLVAIVPWTAGDAEPITTVIARREAVPA